MDTLTRPCLWRAGVNLAERRLDWQVEGCEWASTTGVFEETPGGQFQAQVGTESETKREGRGEIVA